MKPSTLSVVGIAFTLFISQINNALCFAPSPSLVNRNNNGLFKPTNNKIHPIQRRRRSSELFVLEECFNAICSGSFLVAGSELLDASLFAATMDENTMMSPMMTPEYAALDSDPAVSIASAVIFVTLLTLISLGPAAEGEEQQQQQKTAAEVEQQQEDMVTAQATRISATDLAPKEEVANNNKPLPTENLSGVAKNSSNNGDDNVVPQQSTSHHHHGIPLEVGALLKAYKDGDDDLFERALAMLVGTIQSTKTELTETQRLLRLAKEEKRHIEDKYDLRIYQLMKAEEKLKELRSAGSQ